MRTTTYTELLEAVAHGRGALPEDLEAADKARIASALTRAYRYVYEAPHVVGPGIRCVTYTDLIQGKEVTLTAGVVLWADIGNAVAVQFYTKQPAEGVAACDVEEISRDATGIRLNTKLATVWARYVPAPPVAFTHLEYDEAHESGVPDLMYLPGERVYYLPTGKQYECLINTSVGQDPVTNPEKWRVMDVAYTLAEPTITYALSTYMGSEQERLQSKVLSAQAAEQIAQVLSRHGSLL